MTEREYEKGFRKGYWHGFHEVVEHITDGVEVEALASYLWEDLRRWWIGDCSKFVEPPKFIRALHFDPKAWLERYRAEKKLSPGPFVVFVEGAQWPKKKHDKLESAKEEAQRLAKRNPGLRVGVYPAPIAEYVAEVVVKAVEV